MKALVKSNKDDKLNLPPALGLKLKRKKNDVKIDQLPFPFNTRIRMIFRQLHQDRTICVHSYGQATAKEDFYFYLLLELRHFHMHDSTITTLRARHMIAAR